MLVSDNELIERFLAGDRRAFDDLVVRHQKQVYSTAYRMVGNAETAEEIAQETFIRAFKGLRRFRQKANFKTWLYRITMNLCYDEFSRRKKEAGKMEGIANPGAGVATAESPREKMAADEQKMWLKQQISLLPIKQKSTLTLRIFEGMSFKEIGQTLGCTAVSARVNYSHAMLKLKDASTRSGIEL
jgi:RNA polymerase sigma-70 factor (ECF subfamily)